MRAFGIKKNPVYLTENELILAFTNNILLEHHIFQVLLLKMNGFFTG